MSHWTMIGVSCLLLSSIISATISVSAFHSPIRIVMGGQSRDVTTTTTTAHLFNHPAGTTSITPTTDCRSEEDECSPHANEKQIVSTRRRHLFHSAAGMLLMGSSSLPMPSWGEEEVEETERVLVLLSGQEKKLFNEGRALEMQGNIAAAYRIFSKVTNIVPRFVYGWSSLGNTEVVLGKLEDAERSYSTSIDLCNIQKDAVGDQFGVRRCDDLYVLLLNRGSLRLNNKMKKEALQDLELSATLRGKPDAVILQNRARARELNQMYGLADRDYDVAISMTSNEVAPFWLRAAMIKFQLGDAIGALDLLRRVEVKFPEAPEVRAALAAMLNSKGDMDGAKRKFLEIPDRARLKFGSDEYMNETVSWPPAMKENIERVRRAVGDT